MDTHPTVGKMIQSGATKMKSMLMEVVISSSDLRHIHERSAVATRRVGGVRLGL